METNQNIKTWNRDSIYSISALVLAFLSYFGLANLSDTINHSSSAINSFDAIIFNISNGKWLYASLDLWYQIPITLGLIFLLLALFWGIKSVRETSNSNEKGRMLGIMSLTLTSFTIALILLIILPLNQ